MGILRTLRPLVDRTVDGLRERNFKCDPLMGEENSRITSVVSSAYKRHGHILEAAILEGLRSFDRFQVWNDPRLPISRPAEALAATYMNRPAAALASNIAYDGVGERTLQVDLLVHDRERNSVSSYEIKRGAGTHDAGKRRSMLRDLLCTQVILKSYGEQYLELDCDSAHSHIIIYYGAEDLGQPFTLNRDDLDEHFGVPLVREVEKVNRYYRAQIEELLDE